MKELLKQLLKIEERINYLLQIKDFSNWGNLDGFKKNCENLKQTIYEQTEEKLAARSENLMNQSVFLKSGLKNISPRWKGCGLSESIQRFSLKDILENVYEDYTELGR